MNTPVIAFFNNKGGVGKTSLVYHLAWMYADLDIQVVAADIDPQANLTAAFLDEERLETLWNGNDSAYTVFGAIRPLIRGIGDVSEPHLEAITDKLSLLVGDLALSGFEDELSSVWPECMDGQERAFRVITAFWRIMQKAAQQTAADLILLDLGPNLGAINRAALIAADYVVIPLAPDLFSLQGMKNLGPTLRRWRHEWGERLPRNPAPDFMLPSGTMKPIGYIVLQHSVRLDRPVQAYERWIRHIPFIYRESVLGQSSPDENLSLGDDPYLLSLVKHYRSLMPMAQEVHKPIFHLKPADGAIGSHFQSVQTAYQDFEKLANNILMAAKVEIKAQGTRFLRPE